jgi:outer membrane protein assembly factor BamB
MRATTRQRLVVYAILAVCLAAPFALARWRPWEPSNEIWRLETDGPFLGGPAVGAGRIYFASSDQLLHCLAWPERETMWTRPLPGAPGESPLFDPASEMLFVVTRSGDLIALDAATGEQRWMRRIPTVRFRAAPVCDEQRVYLGAHDGWIYAMDKETGLLDWQVFAGGGIFRAPAVGEGVVCVGVGPGHVLALDAETGIERWAYETGGMIHAPPIIHEGAVYIGSRDMHLHAIDLATGEQIWSVRTWHEITTRPAISGDRVVFGSWDHHLLCVERETGRLIWRFQAQDVIDSSPLIVEDTVHFGSWDGVLYAVDLETGHERWRHQTGSWITTLPALTPDGEAILAAGEDANLYALRR